MNTIKIKPCPFCGKIPMLNSKYHDVECSNGSCAVLPSTWMCDTDEEAVELWNTRFSDEEMLSRKEVLDLFNQYHPYMAVKTFEFVEKLKALSPINNESQDSKTYEDGKWEMFELISSAWYGKQCYFKDENDAVYSRLTGDRMGFDAAVLEFIGKISDE